MSVHYNVSCQRCHVRAANCNHLGREKLLLLQTLIVLTLRISYKHKNLQYVTHRGKGKTELNITFLKKGLEKCKPLC